MIAIRLTDSGFRPKFGSILKLVKNPRPILAAAGREGANRLKSHFLAKDRTEANKLAPDRRQHFWQQVAHAVQAPVVTADNTRVDISINHPAIAQKVFGGDIVAKRGKALSIPQSPEAYGRAPAVFEQETGLKLVFISANDHAFLASRRDDDSKFLQVEYLLTPRVHQDKDPTALPDETEFSNAILDRARTVMQRRLQQDKDEQS